MHLSLSDMLKALGIIVAIGSPAIAAYVSIKSDVVELKSGFANVSKQVDVLYEAIIKEKPK